MHHAWNKVLKLNFSFYQLHGIPETENKAQR